MFRVSTAENIPEDEFNAIVVPFEDKCHEYLEALMVIYVGKYISTGYKLSAIWENSYDIIINSAIDIFNHDPEDYQNFKDKVTKELSDKYDLHIASENPLSFK